MFYYIYQITHIDSNKIYVGRRTSKVPPEQDVEYFGSGRLIKRAIAAHGKDRFIKQILQTFSDIASACELEAQIVTEEFVSRSDTYNMHVGGFGGWDHINSDPVERARVSAISSAANISAGRGGCKNHSADTIARSIELCKQRQPYAQSLSNTPESLAKKSLTRQLNGTGIGEKNSQYGTRWITNGTINSKIKSDQPIPEGWWLGRIR